MTIFDVSRALKVQKSRRRLHRLLKAIRHVIYDAANKENRKIHLFFSPLFIVVVPFDFFFFRRRDCLLLSCRRFRNHFFNVNSGLIKSIHRFIIIIHYYSEQFHSSYGAILKQFHNYHCSISLLFRIFWNFLKYITKNGLFFLLVKKNCPSSDFKLH